MEGQTNRNESFPETFDSHQGSPNNNVDRLASLHNRLSPVVSRSSNHMLALHDGSIRRTSTPSRPSQTNRGWDHGESSSTGNNVQEQTSDDESKIKFAWYSSSGTSSVADTGPEDGPREPSTTTSPCYIGNQVTDTSHPLTFRPNHMHLRENDNCNSGLGGHVGAEEILVRYSSSSNLGTPLCSSSTSIENDASGPSLGTGGSSCKRKALEGSSRRFHPVGSSNTDQPMENIMQHPIPGHCTASSADRLEQINSRNRVGSGRVCSGRFASSSVERIAQTPVRNFALRLSPGHRELVPVGSSRGPSFGHSALYSSQPQSQPISNSNALELMSPMTLPLDLNNTLNEPFVNVNEAGRAHHHPWNESLSSRRGSSSSSSLLSGERGHRARDEANFRSSVRNISEYPTIGPASVFEDQIDWSFTPETSASSRSYSGGWSSSAAWWPHGDQTSQDQQRSLESAHWIPFPSIESVSGSRRSRVAPLHLASALSRERATPSHIRHQAERRPPSLSSSSSFLMDARGDNANGRNVLAAVQRRHRLRHVLSAMRRGAPLQDEDYVLINPFVNGFAELHDQNIDMRLDVDNMSYEELLALQEQIGNMSTGLSEEKIRSSMKKRKHGAVKALQAIESCCICQEDYVGGDDIGILDCGHEFHTSCIKQWLILKNICPICKSTALQT